MFKDKNQGLTNEETVIGPSVIVEGDFGGEGNVRVEGTVKGSVKTKQNLYVAPSAKIHASIDAQSASIAGEVKGNIRIREQLEVLATARIIGDVEARTLTVAPGATLNGKLMVGESHAPPAEMPIQKQNQGAARVALK